MMSRMLLGRTRRDPLEQRAGRHLAKVRFGLACLYGNAFAHNIN